MNKIMKNRFSIISELWINFLSKFKKLLNYLFKRTFEKSFLAAALVNILKPHWGSTRSISENKNQQQNIINGIKHKHCLSLMSTENIDHANVNRHWCHNYHVWWSFGLYVDIGCIPIIWVSYKNARKNSMKKEITCVSRIPGPEAKRTTRWNPFIKKLRYHFLWKH